MSVANGQTANQTTFNGAFVSKTVNSTTIGQVTLNNADASSGGTVTNMQRELNSLASFVGKGTNLSATLKPVWTSSIVGASGDGLFERSGALTVKFLGSGGHTHSGSNGQGDQISLTTSVAGVLPVARGGLGAVTFPTGEALFAASGSIDSSPEFSWDDVAKRLRLDGFLGFTQYSITLSSNPVTPTKNVIAITSASTSLAGIVAGALSDVLFVFNATGSTIDVLNQDAVQSAADRIVTGTNADFDLLPGAAIMLIRDTGSNRWRLIGGGGGGGSAETLANFTTSTITLTAAQEQVVRYTGSAALTVATIDAALLPNGGRLTVMALSNDFPVTIPQGIVGAQNGDAVLNVGGTISYIKDATLGIVEVSRNGL